MLVMTVYPDAICMSYSADIPNINRDGNLVSAAPGHPTKQWLCMLPYVLNTNHRFLA